MREKEFGHFFGVGIELRKDEFLGQSRERKDMRVWKLSKSSCFLTFFFQVKQRLVLKGLWVSFRNPLSVNASLHMSALMVIGEGKVKS